MMKFMEWLLLMNEGQASSLQSFKANFVEIMEENHWI
jgi:hypothetical protein